MKECPFCKVEMSHMDRSVVISNLDEKSISSVDNEVLQRLTTANGKVYLKGFTAVCAVCPSCGYVAFFAKPGRGDGKR